MRILWTHNFDPAVANSGVFMHTMRRGMSNLGYQVDLLYLGNLRSPMQMRRAVDDVISVSKRYDIVHSQFGSACAAVSSFASCKRIVSLRGSDWHRYGGRDLRQSFHSVAAFFFTSASLNRFDVAVVMSSRMRSEVSESYRSLRIEVIPDPVDLEVFKPMSRVEARDRIGLPLGTEKYVLFTSLRDSNPIKRAWLAEEAFALADKKIGGLRFQRATGYAHELMPLVVNASDVVLCTSTHEGWPNAIKEGLACGTPFVSTDVSDLAELAKINPSCIVAEANPSAIAAGIVRALSENNLDRDRIVSLVKPLSLDVSCSRLGKLYEELNS